MANSKQKVTASMITFHNDDDSQATQIVDGINSEKVFIESCGQQFPEYQRDKVIIMIISSRAFNNKEEDYLSNAIEPSKAWIEQIVLVVDKRLQKSLKAILKEQLKSPVIIKLEWDRPCGIDTPTAKEIAKQIQDAVGQRGKESTNYSCCMQ